MEKYKVRAVLLDTLKENDLEIKVDESETGDEIKLTAVLDGETFKAGSYYYFAAFQKLRDMLLRSGFGLKCCGARLNAVQSEMASATDKVYLVSLGEQALLKDLVSIYDPADISAFPDFKEQNNFRDKWIMSLNK